MNKKGFTLVELLAVVVVLVIVSLISIPIVTGIIENVKKGAVKSSADGLLRAADVYLAQNMGKVNDPVEFEINDGVQVSKEKLDYNGNIKMGYLMLFSETKKAVCVDDGTYSAYKGVHDEKIKVIEGICTGEYDSETESYLVSQTSKGFTNLSIKSYTDVSKLPKSGNTNDIAIITETKITGYYVSSVAPTTPEEGMVWIVQSNNSPYYLESAYVRIGVSYAMQYESGKWILKHAYVYNEEWKLLYYVDMTDGNINLENSNLGEIKIENTYEYTGEYQEFIAPFSGYYNIQLWGAQGGSANYAGGKGAYTAGNIYLNANETIYVYIGQSGNSTTGGWNGGGTGSGNGRGGGGSTDVRMVSTSMKTSWNEFESLKSRIMVAAGGGGAYSYNVDGTHYTRFIGGDAGSLTGYNSYQVTYDGSSYNYSGYYGIGALQSSGGYSSASVTANVGGFGYGANAIGGGGGGYYGGGGNASAGGGGGGSSYVSGYIGCSSIDEISEAKNIIHNGSAYHYSNRYFSNSVIKDGKDTSMPTYDEKSKMTGNSGNGYAKIKLLTVEYKTEEELIEYKNEKNIEWNYTYSGINHASGSYQTFIAPINGYYNVQLWGAQGGSANYVGGLGAYTKGKIYLTKGEKLYVYVGSKGFSLTAGWNGGGTGSGNGRAGGGATDIRLANTSTLSTWNEFESLKTRIMVAAGGGGAYSYNVDGTHYTRFIGGDAGNLTGYNSYQVTYDGSSYNYSGHYGTGATQSKGGYYSATTTTYSGTFGSGASGVGAGGGGYYGGGGTDSGGGGGGSSYISGYIGCSSINNNSNENDIIHNGSAYHYSNKYFLESVMKDGRDATIPTHDESSLMTGNSGDGYAKIQLVSNEIKTQTEIDNIRIDSDNYWNYSYSGINFNSGKYQTFDAPKNGYYSIELWGAQGGSANYAGGLGAYTKGHIYLNKGVKLYIYVGANGYSTTGGWNGGGTGASYGRGGGGSTDVRTFKSSTSSLWQEADSLKTRIMVAAGGGGSSSYNVDGTHYTRSAGGAAGGLIGYNGYQVTYDGSSYNYSGHYGTGATQIKGGNYSATPTSHTGIFGVGSGANGGGGSGWYGGGGSASVGAGGGGSSYISGHAGCIGVNSSAEPKTSEYSELSDSISYTGYKFTNTVMIDGQGYSWTTEKTSSLSGMPYFLGEKTITGNTGNGYAKITYLGN